MDITTEKIISDAEAKEVLEKRSKEAELKYEQKNAVDVLKKFVKSDSKKIKSLIGELKPISKLRDKQIVAIANLLPEDRDDLRTILHKEYNNFSEDEINKILETVKKAV